MSDRDDQKARYTAYAQAAKDRALTIVQEVRVPDHPTVWETEDGAYVEAQIWIPRSSIDPKPRTCDHGVPFHLDCPRCHDRADAETR